MHRLAHMVVAAEGKRNVTNTTAYTGVGEVRLDPPSGFNKSDRVFVMFLDARGDSENIRIENDILWRESNLVDKDAVGTLANFGFALQRVSLPLLVKGHHDCRRTISHDQLRLSLEFFRPFFKADRIHDALALHATQPSLNDLPL